MATINATISIASPDLTTSPLSLNKTMTLSKAGTTTGLEQTSGIVRRKFTSDAQVDLVTAGAQNYGTPTASSSEAAGKIYIKNTGTSTTDYVNIGLGTSSGVTGATADAVTSVINVTLGRLYGGDWMLIPYDGTATVGDIWIHPSSSSAVSVEYILFFE